MALGITSGTLVINGEDFPFLSNSANLGVGNPTVEVSTLTVGAGVSTTLHLQNLETQVPEIKGKITVSKDNLYKVNEWSARPAGNNVSFLNEIHEFIFKLRGASLTDSVVANLSSTDACFEIVFKGDRI